MSMIRGNDVRIIISQAVRETITGAVDLILPFRCAICGKVSDTEDRSGGYCRLYKELCICAESACRPLAAVKRPKDGITAFRIL